MLPKMQKTLINHPPPQDVIWCVVQSACPSLNTDSHVPWCSYIRSLASSSDLLVPSGGTELLMHKYLTMLLLMPDSLHLAVAQTIRNRCLGSRCFCGRAAPLPYSDAEHFHLTHHLAAQPAATQAPRRNCSTTPKLTRLSAAADGCTSCSMQAGRGCRACGGCSHTPSTPALWSLGKVPWYMLH